MTLPQCQYLQLAQADGILHLTLNRPQARNALTLPMVDEIIAVFAAIADDRSIRAVVLRGAGGYFCAGADLKEAMAGGMNKPAAGEADPVASMNRRFGTMLRQVEQAPQVVIAVCEGAVLGGGFGLVCVSDIALAQNETKFGTPETTRGLPPAQIAPFVVQRIGLTQARRLCLTGARFNGIQAQALGLVHEHFEDETALEKLLAQSLAQVRQCAPMANAVTKALLLQVGTQSMEATLDTAAQAFADAVRGSEAPEGISAFVQKRPPRWAQGSTTGNKP